MLEIAPNDRMPAHDPRASARLDGASHAVPLADGAPEVDDLPALELHAPRRPILGLIEPREEALVLEAVIGPSGGPGGMPLRRGLRPVAREDLAEVDERLAL